MRVARAAIYVQCNAKDEILEKVKNFKGKLLVEFKCFKKEMIK
ncbi:hypothetical protein A2U01_0098420, partial [Trifolium medium]|nr:hypothetical protein [Trifolium medium]